MVDKNQNELIQVEIAPAEFEVNNSFTQLEQDVPLLIERAHQILEQLDFDIDDDEAFNQITAEDEENIAKVIRDMKDVKPVARQVKTARSDVEKFLKQNVKDQMAVLDQRLLATGIDELEDLITISTNLQKKLEAKRKSDRWIELEKHFNKIADAYPLLHEKVPKQLDFGVFKSNNIKLISGAKSKPVTQAMYELVTKYIGELQSDVETILALDSQFQDQLFLQYQLTPNMQQIIKLNNDLNAKEQARLARVAEQEHQRKIAEEAAIQKRIQEEAARQAQKLAAEQEKKRQAEAAKAIEEAKKQAKLQAEKDKANGITPKTNAEPTVIVKTVVQESLTKSDLDVTQASRKQANSPFTETLESYLYAKYADLSNDALLFNALFETIMAIGKGDPDIMRFVKSPTQGIDAVKLLLMARYAEHE